jgi:Undecaprenyl-phosphate glucose phosphotransferase
MIAHEASRPLRSLLLVGDILLLVGAFAAGYAIKFALLADSTEGDYRVLTAAWVLLWVLATSVSRAYNISRLTDIIQAFVHLLRIIALHLLLVTAFVALSKGYLYSREQLLYSYLVAVPLLAAWRLAFILGVRARRRRGWGVRNVAIWGAGRAAEELSEFFRLHPETGYHLAAQFEAPERALPSVPSYPATPEALAEQSQRLQLAELYVSLKGTDDKVLSTLLELADSHLMRIRLLPDFGVFGVRDLQIELYDGLPVVAVQAYPLDEWNNRVLKRSFDIVFSLAFLVLVASWLFPVLAILVRLSSPGPVFFRQKRSGLNGKAFYCYKFRSMRMNADADLRQATSQDERVTPIGAFLRRSNLDELPQFWNVLLGQMSIVGPRPHMISHTQEYRSLIDKYMMRHAVKPGITGLAQARGFRGATPTVWHMRSRVTFDRFYVDNWSLALDIRIIIDTLRMIIRGDHNAV